MYTLGLAGQQHLLVSKSQSCVSEQSSIPCMWTRIVNVIASPVTNRATGTSCNNNNKYLLHIRSEIVLARNVVETLIKAGLAQIIYIYITYIYSFTCELTDVWRGKK